MKVVTVGLNPSDKEFRENTTQPFSTSLRFKRYQTDKPKTLIQAFNAYYKTNPYRWFRSFESVLNGIGASYYDNEKYPNRALHTDICSPWATNPTWSKLPKAIRKELFEEGNPKWIKLIAKLKPNIIVAAVSKEYMIKLGIEKTEMELCRLDHKTDGTPLDNPIIVSYYDYNGTTLVNVSSLNNPYRSLHNEFKQTVGKKIKELLKIPHARRFKKKSCAI